MRKAVACLLCLLMLPLIGCEKPSSALPRAREIDNMALMRTLGVDTGENGLRVTASSGVQNKGAQPPTILTKESGTISGACLAMQAEGSSYVYYGHVGQLLVGEAQAAQGLEDALEYVLRDPEMRLDTVLYIVRGTTAEEAISVSAMGGSSAAERLEAMEEDAGLLSHASPRTVRQVLNDLAQTGSAYAPAIILTSEGDKQVMTAAGYAVLKDGSLAGWADEDAARGINLLQGEMDADVVELELPGKGVVALRVVGAKSQVRPTVEEGRLVGLSVSCQVEANLGEAPKELDIRDKEQREALNMRLSEVERMRIASALELGKELDTDFLNLKAWAGIAAPWHWAEIQAQWNLSALPIAIEVEAAVRRGYDLDS